MVNIPKIIFCCVWALCNAVMLSISYWYPFPGSIFMLIGGLVALNGLGAVVYYGLTSIERSYTGEDG